MRHARRFDCQPESLAGARRFVRDLLSGQPRETVEAAELMTSELATNSVRHARSDFELVVHLSRDEVRVEVSDHGQGQPVPRSPMALDQSGRGLQIVQALAEDWGISPSPNGKLVWFILRLRKQADEHSYPSTASSEMAPEQSHAPKQSHQTDLCSSRSPEQARSCDVALLNRLTRRSDDGSVQGVRRPRCLRARHILISQATRQRH
jgi:anti-sigma regulatory factor (Ser/Thr protein kinase)